MSRKWNSTRNLKFPIEFPDEHKVNLEWIATDDARRQREEQSQNTNQLPTVQVTGNQIAKKSQGRMKWIVLGTIGVAIVLRAWQRYWQSSL
jgi:hypothetical protein